MTRKPQFIVALLVLFAANSSHAVEQTAGEALQDVASARKRFPRHFLRGPASDAALRVVDRGCLYRRGPVEVCPCQPELLAWIFEHPAVAAEFWKRMGVAVWKIQSTKSGYTCDFNDEVHLEFHVLHDGPELRIVYCEGDVRGVLPGSSFGLKLVLVHRYRFAKQTDGRYYVIQQLEAFASGDGLATNGVLRLCRNAWEDALQQCLRELSMFFLGIDRIIETRPKWAFATIQGARPPFVESERNELLALLDRLPPPAAAALPAEFAHQSSAALAPPAHGK